MMKKAPLTRFYQLPNQKGEGWARIWITDDGCFTCLSDYGDYGYWWSSPGCEFREFLCRIDDSYLMGKLGRDDQYDGEATWDAIKSEIITLRRDGSLSPEEAREEWDLLVEHHSDLRDFTEDFARWHDKTSLNDAYELRRTCFPGQLRGFVEHVWPRFVALLRAELANESAGASSEIRPAAPP
jgi:hypothetical protein